MTIECAESMKSVLISIRPKWCELIASGEKTIEVRKTRPKLETPFKCYIYCTRNARDPDKLRVLNKQRRQEYGGLTAVCANLAERPDYHYCGDGKVIGEFVCDAIYPISVTYADPNNHLARRDFPFTGMTDKKIMDYLGNGEKGYGWHISDLKIYDKPLELHQFRTPRLIKCDADCYSEFGYCNGCLGHPGYVCEGLTRPPRSWCYVEEMS